MQRQLEESMGACRGPKADVGGTPGAPASLPPPSRQQHAQARLRWIPCDNNPADAPSRSLAKVGGNLTTYVHDVRAQRRALLAELAMTEDARSSSEALKERTLGPTGQMEKLKAREARPQPMPKGRKGGPKGIPAPVE
jgi:hypothetical protein